jgi:hypothetical protein
VRRERGSTDGTVQRTDLLDLLALVKTAREMAPLVTMECPGCGDLLHLRHLAADEIDETTMSVDREEMELALTVHLRMSCQG